MNEKEIKQAQTIFKTICERLDDMDWQYEQNEEELFIDCTVQGEDFPMDLQIKVDTIRQIVVLISPMPFIVPENRRTSLAIAASVINSNLIVGSFDFDFLQGNIAFRVTTSYRDSLISKKLFGYMFMSACNTIDEFNDKLFMISKKDMSLAEIVEFINK